MYIFIIKVNAIKVMVYIIKNEKLDLNKAFDVQWVVGESKMAISV